MRKWIAGMLTLTLILTVTIATAGVPSISTEDTTSVVWLSTGTSENDPFRIYEVKTPKAVQTEIKRLYDFVNDTEEKLPPSQFFSEEIQTMLQDALPEDLALDTMLVNEIITIDEINYDQKYGDVNVEFKFATAYEEGKTVLILLGLTHKDVSEEWDENEDREEYTKWVSVEAIALENGDLLILFPQEVLLEINEATAVTMIVFNEP